MWPRHNCIKYNRPNADNYINYYSLHGQKHENRHNTYAHSVARVKIPIDRLSISAVSRSIRNVIISSNDIYVWICARIHGYWLSANTMIILIISRIQIVFGVDSTQEIWINTFRPHIKIGILTNMFANTPSHLCIISFN